MALFTMRSYNEATMKFNKIRQVRPLYTLVPGMSNVSIWASVSEFVRIVWAQFRSIYFVSLSLFSLFVLWEKAAYNVYSLFFERCQSVAWMCTLRPASDSRRTSAYSSVISNNKLQIGLPSSFAIVWSDMLPNFDAFERKYTKGGVRRKLIKSSKIVLNKLIFS